MMSKSINITNAAIRQQKAFNHFRSFSSDWSRFGLSIPRGIGVVFFRVGGHFHLTLFSAAVPFFLSIFAFLLIS